MKRSPMPRGSDGKFVKKDTKSSAPRKRPRATGPDKKTRELVLERDRHRCVRCGQAFRPAFPLGYSIQHRRARGMGGSSDPSINSPANLVSLCGSATTGCHRWAESRDELATEYGYVISQHNGVDPATVPVRTWHGWVMLNDDGTQKSVNFSQEEPAPTDIAHLFVEDSEPGLEWRPPKYTVPKPEFKVQPDQLA